jgi:maltose alpha-D-glucosyltransferase / alpha-amylase
MDPLWYKDAILYETHVKAFFDSDGDGIGDFPGLLQKLDYLQDLGVTCLWLLPFFPSPLRDDGYDIADYTNVHPTYGTLDDFKTFLNAAHERNLQVVIELVINHTSDQHPWFQAARKAPSGSPEREIYVWSDTDKKYSDARIIFSDTEKSNWTWDPVANAYYWHRFFSHQPDLNFDNPHVIERVLKAMRFWLDMGVDGLRLDAIPYLVERDETNCENLAETHEVIRRIRQELDKHYHARMLLAEANQWPTDVRPYFGDGDECHMAFHFPVMPRIFMALRMEDRHPISDIMAQTPDIPENCQWGLFLRNHDELTLEMVTADERDYMYLAYSADPKMKINVGIRRRLAPLMENNRRRIELLSSLLFSFPGTPIIYYGDEIGMGDNIYLGDRNGVRTPMQWSPDRNAGFSRANPARLYSPVIMDPVYGYEGVNVEAQISDSSSLLHWMRNMIGLRKLFKVFGRGTIEFLSPQNRKVLAYLRQYKDDQILCVANLSRFAQAVELDLSVFAGMKPVEMFGYSEFPVIGTEPYVLSLNPYGFFWFELHGTPGAAEPRVAPAVEEVESVAAGSWLELFESSAGEVLENIIFPRFLPAQRWFAGKGMTVEAVRVYDWTALQDTPFPAALVLLRVRYSNGSSETYFVPISVMNGEHAAQLLSESPDRVLCRIDWNGSASLLCDGITDDETCRGLLKMIGSGADILSRRGTIRALPTRVFPQLRETVGEIPAVSRTSREQSNTSVFFGDRLMLKLYRKMDTGVNPEFEVLRYLTEDAGFDRAPQLAGGIEYVPFEHEPQTMAILESAVENQGNGWEWMLEELSRFYEHCAAGSEKERAMSSTAHETEDVATSAVFREAIGLSLESAATLGRRTAEMHLALASRRDIAAFSPEAFLREDFENEILLLRAEAADSFKILRDNLSRLPEDSLAQAGQLLRDQKVVTKYLDQLVPFPMSLSKIRIHGDYHLGQVLHVRNDYVIIDFEGEPGRPLAERRLKTSPLKDVAGMLRSFSYAAYTGLFNYTNRRPDQLTRLSACAASWEAEVSSLFLKDYCEFAKGASFLPQDPAGLKRLLDVFVLVKAFYELRYEINNRPAWVRIPVQAIMERSAGT